MARHIILESGCPVNLDYLVVAYRENDQYYLMLFGIDRKISITEKDFQGESRPDSLSQPVYRRDAGEKRQFTPQTARGHDISHQI